MVTPNAVNHFRHAADIKMERSKQVTEQEPVDFDFEHVEMRRDNRFSPEAKN